MQTLPKNWHRLFTNHMDAWGITFVIVSGCLFVHDAISAQTIRLMLAIAAIYWLGFAINDYYDAPYDADDAQKAERNIFTQFEQGQWALALVFVLVIAIYLLGFASYGIKGLLIFVPSVIVMWGYSAPPLRLKSRPIVDLFTHMLFVQTYPYLVTWLLIEAQLLAVDIGLLVFFACSSLAAQLEQQARDYHIDSVNDRNFTTQFGKNVTVWLLKIVTGILVAVGLFIFFGGIIPPILMPFFLLGTPPVLHRYFRRTSRRPERLIKVSVLIGVMYTVSVWTYLLLA